MGKLKDIKKRILRLEAGIQKDTKKLSKLKAKLQAATKAKTASSKGKSSVFRKSTQASKAPKKVPKRGSTITREGRARLSALMKAKWAAKKAAEGQQLPAREA